MRPDPHLSKEKLYECFSCGTRIDAPKTPLCPNCGGELHRIAQSRDL